MTRGGVSSFLVDNMSWRRMWRHRSIGVYLGVEMEKISMMLYINF